MATQQINRNDSRDSSIQLMRTKKSKVYNIQSHIRMDSNSFGNQYNSNAQNS